MKRARTILAATTAVLMAVPAHAVVPVWSANATSCVADSLSIEQDRYTTAGLRIAHRANNVDPIRLVCEVSDPSSFLGSLHWKLVVTYRDSTGAATSANVIARVFRASRTTGNAAVVATFDSNSRSAIGIAKNSISFDHAFDFDNDYYFVQVVLDRTLTTEIVEAFGVAIEPIEM
jgi:hypothetical protein